MNTIFNIEQKQDSPEKLASVVGIPERFYINADEFNDVTRSALESTIENVKIDFSWSNKKEHVVTGWNNISTVQLLVMNFRAEWMLENTDEVWLLIDRYKPKRTVRTSGKLKQSGFKHGMYPDEENSKRPSEILITSKEMVLEFGQPFYFHKVTNTLSKIRTSGAGGKNYIGDDRAWQYLQFQIRVKKGSKVYYSKPLATIQMICNRFYNDGNIQRISISYKLV
ncbi:hypothetical protein NTJ28_001693 [Flavobacterium psychrophilum]|nr:hypothetical protein [Flavobacterium psychrophilum]EKT4510330.1 hypothetical protein [Flavobacterium psychrophilum]